ncbi:MAG: glycosyltransferase family 1 protein [Thermoplasmata archaeon]
MEMDIAFINNSNRYIGFGRYACNLYDHLKDKCNIKQYFFDRGKYALLENKKIFCKLDKNVIFDNFLTRRLKMSNLLLDFRLARFIPNDYDIYHITNQENSILTYYPNISASVVTVHDIFYYTLPKNFIHQQLIKLLYYGITNANRIICVSQATKNDLIKHFNLPSDKIDVVYPGLDPIFKKEIKNAHTLYEKYNLEPSHEYILHVGRDEKRKNIETLLRAFYKLKRDFNLENVKLIKINKLSETNKKLLHDLNLENEVYIIDRVSEEDLVRFYKISDIFVFPSIMEGFGLPLIEAMACGTPIIASNTSAIPEVVEDAAILVNPKDINAFSESLYNLLTDEDLKEELIKKGMKRLSKFKWENSANKTLKVYKKVKK